VVRRTTRTASCKQKLDARGCTYAPEREEQYPARHADRAGQRVFTTFYFVATVDCRSDIFMPPCSFIQGLELISMYRFIQ
jgi:hypothetical protein